MREVNNKREEIYDLCRNLGIYDRITRPVLNRVENECSENINKDMIQLFDVFRDRVRSILYRKIRNGDL